MKPLQLTNILCICVQGQQTGGHFGYPGCVCPALNWHLLVRCLPLTKCHVLVCGETPPQKCHIRCDAHGPKEMGDGHPSWQPQKSFGRQPQKFASVWFLTSDRRDRAVLSLEQASEAPFFSHAPVQRQTPHFGSSSTQGLRRTNLHCAGSAHAQWWALRVDSLS